VTYWWMLRARLKLTLAWLAAQPRCRPRGTLTVVLLVAAAAWLLTIGALSPPRPCPPRTADRGTRYVTCIPAPPPPRHARR
jgi:hypothetical protein